MGTKIKYLLMILLIEGFRISFQFKRERSLGRSQIGLCVLAVIFIGFIPFSTGYTQSAQRDWGLTLCFGKLTDAKLTDAATFNFRFEDAYFIDLGLLRRLYTFQDYFNIEIEGQIAKHFGDQDQWEFNGVAYFRWLVFPWDRYLETSFAAGSGLSYATSVPKIEAKNYDEAARFLAALMFEFAFSLPGVPQWSLITRLHHRSGAYGTFDDVHGASNAWGMGIRYNF
jgi:hypothetical protein